MEVFCLFETFWILAASESCLSRSIWNWNLFKITWLLSIRLRVEVFELFEVVDNVENESNEATSASIFFFLLLECTVFGSWFKDIRSLYFFLSKKDLCIKIAKIIKSINEMILIAIAPPNKVKCRSFILYSKHVPFFI